MAQEQQRPCAQPLTAASRGWWCCGHRGHPAVPGGLPPVPMQEAVGANPVQAASAAAARATAPAPPGPAELGGQCLSQGRGQNPRALEPGHRAEAGSATGGHAELNNTRCSNPRESTGKHLVTNTASDTQGRLRAADDCNFPSTTKDFSVAGVSARNKSEQAG